MSVIRYGTLNDFVPTTFSNLVDRFLNESAGRSGGAAYSFSPRVDVIENEKSFEIHVAIPGMAKEDIKIDLNENILNISGERKFARELNENHYRSIGTQYGTFSRSFSLPENVDGTKINAKYNNGILELTIPKDEKKTLKQTIQVN